MQKENIKKIVFKKMILIISVFLMGIINVNAVGYNYSKFNWETFAEENKDYWTSICETDEDNGKCTEMVLKSQKKFYKKLYRILTRYERKGLYIKDYIIIATAFYGLSPDFFTDPNSNSEYNKIFGEDSAYDIDEDLDFIDDEDNDENNRKYYNALKEEKDTIQLLAKAMIAYNVSCIGINNVETRNNSGITEKYCKIGNLDSSFFNKEVCSGTFTMNPPGEGFWEKARRSVGDFFGMKSSKEKECASLTSNGGFTSYKYIVDTTKSVNEDNYWYFLTNGDYFDKKPHLQHYYQSILEETNHEKMTELSNAEKEKYADEIIKVREGIVEEIKEVIKQFEDSDESNVKYLKTSSSKAWWPVGSEEIETIDDKEFAKGNPVFTSVTENFKAGDNSKGGIDITSDFPSGTVNIIAVKDGIVTKVLDNCTSLDKECGSGYGNYIMISHFDGTFTTYSHLAEDSLKVKLNDNVKQGQVIAKMGDTGDSNGVSLHFEVRTDTGTKVNPLNYVDQNNPRPSPGVVNLVNGEENKQTICLTLLNSGISENGTAALMTNISTESGFRNNAIGDSGTSYGLCQWHLGRWDNLKIYSPDNWEEIDGQLAFLFHELESGYDSLYNNLVSGASSAYDMTFYFCHDFERPANKEVSCKNRANKSDGFLTYVMNGCH